MQLIAQDPWLIGLDEPGDIVKLFQKLEREIIISFVDIRVSLVTADREPGTLTRFNFPGFSVRTAVRSTIAMTNVLILCGLLESIGKLTRWHASKGFILNNKTDLFGRTRDVKQLL